MRNRHTHYRNTFVYIGYITTEQENMNTIGDHYGDSFGIKKKTNENKHNQIGNRRMEMTWYLQKVNYYQLTFWGGLCITLV